MSADRLEALAAAARTDPQLAERLSAATTIEDTLAIAADAGFDITTDDLKAVAAAVRANGELTEQDLASAAGGTYASAVVCPTEDCW